MSKTVKLCIAAILCGLVALSCVGVVHAQALDAGVIAAPIDAGVAVAPALPDPVANPAESVSYVVKLWKSGTMPAAFIVGMFLLLTAASAKVKALQQGYAAIICASLIGGLAILLESASRGTTPTLATIGTALVAAVALALNPKKAVETEPGVS